MRPFPGCQSRHLLFTNDIPIARSESPTGAMNRSVISAVYKQRSHLFNLQFSPEYKLLIPNQILSDRRHPLHELKKKKLSERKKIGLWWFTTSPADLSRSCCVRTWARRRLREAIVEELKARGYDERGIPLKGRKLCDLKGSLRLNVQPPILSAKFEEVKAETRKLVDVLVQASNGTASQGFEVKKAASKGPKSPLNQRSARLGE